MNQTQGSMHVWTDGYGYGAVFPTSENEIKKIHESHAFLSSLSGEEEMLGRDNYATFWGEKSYAAGTRNLSSMKESERSQLSRREFPNSRKSTASSRRRAQTGKSNRLDNVSPITRSQSNNFHHTEFRDNGMNLTRQMNSPLRSSGASSMGRSSNVSPQRAQTAAAVQSRRSRMFDRNSPAVGGLAERETPGPQSWNATNRSGVPADFHDSFGGRSRSPSPGNQHLGKSKSSPVLSVRHDIYRQRPATTASDVDWDKFATFSKGGSTFPKNLRYDLMTTTMKDSGPLPDRLSKMHPVKMNEMSHIKTFGWSRALRGQKF